MSKESLNTEDSLRKIVEKYAEEEKKRLLAREKRQQKHEKAMEAIRKEHKVFMDKIEAQHRAFYKEFVTDEKMRREQEKTERAIEMGELRLKLAQEQEAERKELML